MWCSTVVLKKNIITCFANTVSSREDIRKSSSMTRYVRFEVVMAVKMLFLFFWVVTSCGLIGRYQHFRETYCLHRQGWPAIYRVLMVCVITMQFLHKLDFIWVEFVIFDNTVSAMWLLTAVAASLYASLKVNSTQLLQLLDHFHSIRTVLDTSVSFLSDG
jgi:hypothetical protein